MSRRTLSGRITKRRSDSKTQSCERPEVWDRSSYIKNTFKMPQGDKSKYTDKQKRQAAHIEKSEEKEGKSKKTAERIAYATVNKQDGGGKKGGSGEKRTRAKS